MKNAIIAHVAILRVSGTEELRGVAYGKGWMYSTLAEVRQSAEAAEEVVHTGIPVPVEQDAPRDAFDNSLMSILKGAASFGSEADYDLASALFAPQAIALYEAQAKDRKPRKDKKYRAAQAEILKIVKRAIPKRT